MNERADASGPTDARLRNAAVSVQNGGRFYCGDPDFHINDRTSGDLRYELYCSAALYYFMPNQKWANHRIILHFVENRISSVYLFISKLVLSFVYTRSMVALLKRFSLSIERRGDAARGCGRGPRHAEGKRAGRPTCVRFVDHSPRRTPVACIRASRDLETSCELWPLLMSTQRKISLLI
ncbi:hypothetical protein ACJJTC_012212 [Scirpophaga incertulas]